MRVLDNNELASVSGGSDELAEMEGIIIRPPVIIFTCISEPGKDPFDPSGRTVCPPLPEKDIYDFFVI